MTIRKTKIQAAPLPGNPYFGETGLAEIEIASMDESGSAFMNRVHQWLEEGKWELKMRMSPEIEVYQPGKQGFERVDDEIPRLTNGGVWSIVRIYNTEDDPPQT